MCLGANHSYIRSLILRWIVDLKRVHIIGILSTAMHMHILISGQQITISEGRIKKNALELTPKHVSSGRFHIFNQPGFLC